MSAQFDLHLFILNFIAGQEQPEIPGLLVSAAPHHAARGRADDLLMALITTVGSTVLLTNDEMQESLLALCHAYFSEPGTVTSGMKAAAHKFNGWLLKRNSKIQDKPQQVLATLNLAVIRKDVVYLAHYGQTHSFILGTGVNEHFYDPQALPRALGTGRVSAPAFHQSQVHSGGLIIFCAEPPQIWTQDILSQATQSSLESVRRRLLQRFQGDLKAVVFQFQPGSGLIRRLRRRGGDGADQTGPVATAIARPVLMPEVPEAVPEPQHESSPVLSVAVQTPPDAQMGVSQPVVAPPRRTFSQALQSSSPAVPQKSGRSGASRPQNMRSTSATQPVEEKPAQTLSQRIEPARQRLGVIWLRAKDGQQKFFSSLRRMFVRLLPGLDENLPVLSPGVSLFIAIAVPVMIVAAATTIYLRNGRNVQYQQNYDTAQTMVNQAQSQPDLALQRNNLEEALKYLDNADSFKQTDESAELRKWVSLSLDDMDGITRVEMESALGGQFVNSVHITQMIANGTDVYLLDSSSGRVIRLVLTGKGYERDDNFKCPYEDGPNVGAGMVVDIVALPLHNPYHAAVMALRTDKTIFYCTPGSAPVSAQLLPPDVPTGEYNTFTLQDDNLYVLDKSANAIWLYKGVDLLFESEPRFYFGNEVPVLTDVMDLAVNGDELFILHQDGKMSLCVYSGYKIAPTTCTDPAPYGDMRQGRELSSLVFASGSFTHLLSTRPPDPSLYLLDAKSGVIYHFSLRLKLHRQLRMEVKGGFMPVTENPTAFVVTTGRVLLLAYNNQVYFAALP